MHQDVFKSTSSDFKTWSYYRLYFVNFLVKSIRFHTENLTIYQESFSKDFGTSQRGQNFPKGFGICLFVVILTPTLKLLMCEAILAKKTRKLSTTIFAGDIVVFNVWSNKGGRSRWNPSSFSEVSLIGNLSWSHLNVWDLTGVLRILCCHEFEGHNTWLTQFGSCQVSIKQYDMGQRINISVYVHMFAQNRCIIGFPEFFSTTCSSNEGCIYVYLSCIYISGQTYTNILCSAKSKHKQTHSLHTSKTCQNNIWHVFMPNSDIVQVQNHVDTMNWLSIPAFLAMRGLTCPNFET